MMGKKYVRGKEEQDHEYIVGGAHAQRAPDLFVWLLLLFLFVDR